MFFISISKPRNIFGKLEFLSLRKLSFTEYTARGKFPRLGKADV